ncbi:FAD-dependent oxidoreductase [Rhodohalobacter mucosus]|uniref:FAD-dependent monooxygenase n=1 Tax=Rhodohalobacter mucosus TaxID=2079485 RepID=A0A316TPU4_9BACT|nr:NAD(P)/FAD-dependent oxidoreductase [Rhodohalobacter mucosus]PWN05219.1 FAD-dependent monooxygenase [Rhodohalobacter mucosus]
MTIHETDTDITIIGGGPVGLYLAIRLLNAGISCTVLEKNSTIDPHSKSLGIHPVSLNLFDHCGLTPAFLNQGLKIRSGIAFWNRDRIGKITFDNLPGEHRYILSLPQWRTEKILSDKVNKLKSDCLLRGAEVTEIQDNNEDRVQVAYKKNGANCRISSQFVVGCDGKTGFLRDALDIPFHGKSYPDTYIMGDYTDNTSFGHDAAVYLHEEGLIECFPLPDGQRRWVVKTDEYIREPQSKQLEKFIQHRLGHSLDGCRNSMVSSFGVQHFLAEQFHHGRCLLAGDAAHIVSPIGGQGMNLGWLDAEETFSVIQKALTLPEKYPVLFRQYSSERKKIARQVARRAELNMHLGRKESSSAFYRGLVSLMLNTPLSGLFAKIFTMHGLGKWPV